MKTRLDSQSATKTQQSNADVIFGKSNTKIMNALEALSKHRLLVTTSLDSFLDLLKSDVSQVEAFKGTASGKKFLVDLKKFLLSKTYATSLKSLAALNSSKALDKFNTSKPTVEPSVDSNTSGDSSTKVTAKQRRAINRIVLLLETSAPAASPEAFEELDRVENNLRSVYPWMDTILEDFEMGLNEEGATESVLEAAVSHKAFTPVAAALQDAYKALGGLGASGKHKDPVGPIKNNDQAHVTLNLPCTLDKKKSPNILDMPNRPYTTLIGHMHKLDLQYRVLLRNGPTGDPLVTVSGLKKNIVKFINEIWDAHEPEVMEGLEGIRAGGIPNASKNQIKSPVVGLYAKGAATSTPAGGVTPKAPKAPKTPKAPKIQGRKVGNFIISEDADSYLKDEVLPEVIRYVADKKIALNASIASERLENIEGMFATVAEYIRETSTDMEDIDMQTLDTLGHTLAASVQDISRKPNFGMLKLLLNSAIS